MRWAGRSQSTRVRLTCSRSSTHWLSSVGPAHGERRVALDAARRLLRTSSASPRELHRLLASATLAVVEPAPLESLLLALDAALRRGELSVLETPSEARSELPLLPRPPAPPPSPEPSPLPEHDPSVRALVEVTVLDAACCPIPALPLHLREAGGKQHTWPSDASGYGRFPLQSADEPSMCVGGYHELDWPAPLPEPTPPPPGAQTIEAYLSLLAEEGPSWTLAAQTHTYLLLERPRLWSPSPPSLYFDHDSALPSVGPWTEGLHPLAPLVHCILALLEHPERSLFMIGRASAPGKAAHNQSLSEARAAMLRALLDDDRDIWVTLAQEHGSGRDILAYFDYLGRERGWSCACETPIEELSGQATAATRACVRAFQSEYNQRFEGELARDGECGRKTLGAGFRVLRDELERWLAKLGIEPAQLEDLRPRLRSGGYGATLAKQGGAGAEAARLERVVDLFLYDGQDDAHSIPLERLYASGLPRHLPFPLPHEPNAWATGPFTIVSDLTEHETFEPETYRLTSDDERVVDERVLPDDAHIEAGEYVLYYEALPTDARYSLVVIAANGDESVIFSGLSYGQLHPSRPTQD